MAKHSLRGCRILVVEDEYLLADEITQALSHQGAIVLGPVPSVKEAIALLDGAALPDGAILDLNLGGDPAYPVADVLIERGVPVVFATGYDAGTIPERFAHVTRCEKPISVGRVTEFLARTMGK